MPIRLKLTTLLVLCLLFSMIIACSDNSADSPTQDIPETEQETTKPNLGSEVPTENENPFAFSTQDYFKSNVFRVLKPGSSQGKNPDRADERLIQMIATGENGDDYVNSWLCTTENILGRKTELSLRFWMDFTGDISSHRMNWILISNDSIKITVEQKGVVYLSDIEFESKSNEYDYFSAADNFGELSSCHWEGMIRSINMIDGPAVGE